MALGGEEDDHNEASETEVFALENLHDLASPRTIPDTQDVAILVPRKRTDISISLADWKRLHKEVQRLADPDFGRFQAIWGSCFGCSGSAGITALTLSFSAGLPAWLHATLWSVFAVGLLVGGVVVMFERRDRRKHRERVADIVDHMDEIGRGYFPGKKVR